MASLWAMPARWGKLAVAEFCVLVAACIAEGSSAAAQLYMKTPGEEVPTMINSFRGITSRAHYMFGLCRKGYE